MRIENAIKQTTGHKPGFNIRSSIKYAQSLLDNKEKIVAAVTANIRTSKEHYPAVVLLTKKRIVIVHKMFHIKRVMAYPYEKFDVITEKKSVIQYEVIFHVGGFQFIASLNKRDGEAFEPYLKKINAFIPQKEYREQKYKKEKK